MPRVPTSGSGQRTRCIAISRSCAAVRVTSQSGGETKQAGEKRRAVMSFQNLSAASVEFVTEWDDNETIYTIKVRNGHCRAGSESQPLLHPKRRQFKIRNTKYHVPWYHTELPGPIKTPPDYLSKKHSLYVHRHDTGTQLWMSVHRARDCAGDDDETCWQRVCEGDPHPELDGYVLHMVQDKPRWVKAASARSYNARQIKKAS
ncbi:hypothetical protein C8Q80DRAFT_472904 [Daedaleopsis nitida]|nr:hypothetical protein C8Q80DRAFT_472904 [Daedaleopsis nitida]